MKVIKVVRWGNPSGYRSSSTLIGNRRRIIIGSEFIVQNRGVVDLNLPFHFIFNLVSLSKLYFVFKMFLFKTVTHVILYIFFNHAKIR